MSNKGGAMDEKDIVGQVAKSPLAYSLATYFWVILLGMWGGVVRFFRMRLNTNEPWWHDPRQIVSFLVEMSTSAFVAVLAFYICEAQEVPQIYTAAIVGMCGHEGGRSMDLLIKYIEKKIGGF